MKKLLTIALIGLVSTSMLFAQGKGETQEGSKAKKYKVKFANTQGDKDTQSIGLYEVAEKLNASGLFDIEVYTSSALGGTDDITEQAMQGAPVLTVSDPGRMMAFVPDFGIIQMPYLFENSSVLDKLIKTNTYKDWETQFEAKGIKLITSNWYSGARNFVLNKEVNTPEDLAGQKIRTIGSPLFTKSVSAMGAVATPMSWSEVYSAIQQGAIDGAEVQTPSSYATRLYEICSTTNKSEHFQLIGCVVMGTKTFNSWSKEAQELFVNTFIEVGTENQKLVAKLTKEYEEDMVKKGMVVREIDKTPFIEAVQPVYEELNYSQLRDQIKKELAN